MARSFAWLVLPAANPLTICSSVNPRSLARPASLQEIAAALHRGKATDTLIEGSRALANLSSQLSRAKEDFISVARGRWGLVEWYPGRAVKRAQKMTDDDTSSSKTDDENAAAEEKTEGVTLKRTKFPSS